MKIIYLPKGVFREHPTEFRLIEFDVHRGMVMNESGHYRHRTKIVLRLALGGQELTEEIRLRPKEEPDILPMEEPAGPYDLLQKLLVQMLVRRWPSIADFLNKHTAVNNTTVHEIHPDGERPYVSAIWKCMMSVGKKRTLEFSAACESQDSIRAVVLALIAAYKLIVYRWLLQEETHKRVAARLKNHPPRPNIRRRNKGQREMF